jgi:hypothetical protein
MATNERTLFFCNIYNALYSKYFIFYPIYSYSFSVAIHEYLVVP